MGVQNPASVPEATSPRQPNPNLRSEQVKCVEPGSEIPISSADNIFSFQSLERLTVASVVQCTICHEHRPVNEVTVAHLGWICAECCGEFSESLGLNGGCSDAEPQERSSRIPMSVVETGENPLLTKGC